MNARKQAIDMIIVVASSLGALLDQFMFVGGAVAGLLITDPAAPDVRPTTDVDITIEMVSITAYYQLEESLRDLDFKNSMEPGLLFASGLYTGHWSILCPVMCLN